MTNDFRQVLKTARPLLVDLSSWHNEQLNSTRPLLEQGSSANDARRKTHLQLAYYGARLTVIRALLRTFDNPDVESSLAESDVFEFSEARQRCREAAKTCTIAVINFVSSLSGKDFEQFWPYWSTGLIAQAPYMAMLLVVTSREASEAGGFKWLLFQMRKALRTQSQFFDTLKLASLRLDAHFWRGFDNILMMDPKLGLMFDQVVEVPLPMDTGT